MTGKKIEAGHIVAVRYGWNSYVGVMTQFRGLQLAGAASRFAGAAPYHSINPEATYQVLAHTSPNHPDYDYEVNKWYYSEDGECPVNIRVYENYEAIK